MVKTHPNFDLIAPFYDTLANWIFGKQLEAAQTHFLSDLEDPESVLIFGGGTGKIIQPLLMNYPEVSICFLDNSAKMISLAQTSTSFDDTRIQFIQDTEQYLIDKPNCFDVIITPFILDVFESQQLNSVMQLLFNSLKSQGKWVQTDFCVGQSSPKWHIWMLRFMYKFFRFTTGMQNQSLPDFDQLFKKFPLAFVDERSFYHRMIKTTLFKKGLGVGTQPLEEVAKC